MHVFYGARALSPFRVEQLTRRVQVALPALKALDTQYIYLAWFNGAPPAAALRFTAQLCDALDTRAHQADATSVVVAPRRGTISPWCSKAMDIALNCGIAQLQRFERAIAWSFDGIAADDITAVTPFIHDRMTEEIFPDTATIDAAHTDLTPRSIRSIGLDNDAHAALSAANISLGLALNDEEIAYLANRYAELGRDPFDVELMMFAQANSEHCRHKIFNAEWRLDGAAQPCSLFDMIRHSYAQAPHKILSAYADNAAVTSGYRASRFFAITDTGEYRRHAEDVHILMKVETHNHPTAIAPYPGAATGSGGEIRDEGATGRGAKPKAGLTGFSVSHLRIPDFVQAWECVRDTDPRLASALEIMTDGPLGAAAFNNEFGRPGLCGYFRSFEHISASGEVRAYDKPIMLAGGVGNIRPADVRKHTLHPGAMICVLGGPAMLIGLGGGAASSMQAGSSDNELDFASVQRDNPEMQRRCQEVLNSCWARGTHNPIISVHDVGAGGLSNAVPEILNDSATGGRIELRAIPNADPTLSPLEIWCNEAQERYVLAIARESERELKAICARERCPLAIIGEVTAEQRLYVYDATTSTAVIDLPMDLIFGAPPKMSRAVCRVATPQTDFTTDDVTLDDALHRVLRFPTVADKRFLITIGDRNVGGLSVRDQFVGPWQVPVADCAVSASDFGCTTGEAMAIGERAPLALLDPPASGRMAVGEAITNLAAARIMQLTDVVLSANWMAAAGHPGEDARLFDTVRAVALELCPALGIAIPVGKDSMSMKATWQNAGQEKTATAPLSLIVSAFAPVVDIRQTLTPVLRTDVADSCLVFIDLAAGCQRLGGSILAQCYRALGATPPDLDAPARIVDFFRAIQLLNETGYLLAYHDRADGGLIVTLCEMAFAARTGLEIDISAFGHDPMAALFCEELGAVVQIRGTDFDAVRSQFSTTLSEHIHLIGRVDGHRRVRIHHGGENLLDVGLEPLLESWSATTYHMQTHRDNPACAAEEFSAIRDLEDPGLHLAPSFEMPAPALTASIHTTRPKIAILREQGVNGQVEMAAAFDRAGMLAVDVHMSDIKSGERSLRDFVGMVACGGFSYGDVLGAGGGWAKSILHQDKTRREFADFFRRDTFTLGVCNGCQMLAHLRELIPGASHWPNFERNRSEQFEARLVMVEVLASPSIFLRDMGGTRAPIVIAHGEGRAEFSGPHATQTCLRFVDNRGHATAQYPFNPNGSVDGITGVTSDDGRVTIMMPHPERVFLSSQFSWLDPNWTHEEGPWMKIFRNARDWLKA